MKHQRILAHKVIHDPALYEGAFQKRIRELPDLKSFLQSLLFKDLLLPKKVQLCYQHSEFCGLIAKVSSAVFFRTLKQRIHAHDRACQLHTKRPH